MVSNSKRFYLAAVFCGLLLVMPNASSSALAEEWVVKAPMHTRRHGFGCGVVDGMIYAPGGYSLGSAIATVERYDPILDSWEFMAPMPIANSGHCCAVVNGTIYAFGGADVKKWTVQEYEPQTNTWQSRTSMPTGRESPACAVVEDKIYVIGGGEDASNVVYNIVEVYDPATNSWDTSTSPMPTARRGLTCAAVNGKIYAIGGRLGYLDPHTDVNIVEIYDVATDSWQTGPSMPTARAFPASVAVDGMIYVIGGLTPVDSLGVVERYDPVSTSWTSLPDMTPRYAPGAAAVEGTIYAIGGHGGHPATDMVINEALGVGPAVASERWETYR